MLFCASIASQRCFTQKALANKASNTINSRIITRERVLCLRPAFMRSPSLVCPSQYVDAAPRQAHPIFTLQFFQQTANHLPRGAQLNGQILMGNQQLSLIHISEPTRRTPISYAV